MKARERYRVLLDKYYTAYSSGRSTFQQLMKKVHMLNRHYAKYLYTLLFCLLLCSTAYARGINVIIVHHTNDNNIDESAEGIDVYHKSKDWDEIGYHYVIRRNGNLEFGRDDEKIGAHYEGRNAHSLGIALSGNTATQEQLSTLSELLSHLCNEYDIASIERHHEECPGVSVPVEEYNKEFIR